MAPPPRKPLAPTTTPERNFESEIAAYEGAIEQCRVAYERYFAGLERREPQDLRKRCEAIARSFPEGSIRNSGLKFRLQTARQKWTTYTQHWARVVRQIEEGTYKRDRDRAEKRFGPGALASAPRGVEEISGSDLLEDDDDDSITDLNELARRAAGSTQPMLAPPAPTSRFAIPSSSGSAVDLATPSPPSSVPVVPRPAPPRDPYRSVYERYVSERLARGDTKAASLSYEAVAQQLKATETQLRAKYTGRNVEFDVAEKDGKVVLKPIVK
jgi:hypothetical protein